MDVFLSELIDQVGNENPGFVIQDMPYVSWRTPASRLIMDAIREGLWPFRPPGGTVIALEEGCDLQYYIVEISFPKWPAETFRLKVSREDMMDLYDVEAIDFFLAKQIFDHYRNTRLKSPSAHHILGEN